jgi:hypothetical protein
MPAPDYAPEIAALETGLASGEADASNPTATSSSIAASPTSWPALTYFAHEGRRRARGRRPGAAGRRVFSKE